MATRRRRGNPRNKAPGTRGLSTSEYGMATSSTWKGAKYAYPRGVGRDRGKRPSYPINNLARARNALTRAAQPNTAGTVGHVKMVLRKKGGAYARLADRSHAGEG
jgi:hypothetical protein